jgi:molybdopterin molybdotransferase
LILFDEAVRRVADLARPLGAERVALAEAQDRVLAAPVIARRTAPSCAVSAMDGYAVRDSDVARAPVRLPVIGAAFAGQGFDGVLAPGTCVRIFTGAPAPPGADRIIVQETVTTDGDMAFFAAAPSGGRHLRAAGSDFEVGDLLVEPGARLNPQRLVAAAAADLATLEVVRRPRVVILGTGDELRAPGSATASPQSIPESVSHGVAARVRQWGGDVIDRQQIVDRLPALEAAARAAVARADLVVVIGGASVGERDFGKAMFAPLDLDLVFSRVAIKPGKPVWLGRASGVLIVGLPGNPSSAMVTARLLLAPLVAGLAGRGADTALHWRRRPLSRDIEACGDRETFVRGRRQDETVEPLQNQDSSAQKVLALSDLLIRRRPGQATGLAGSEVEVLRL